MGKRKINFPKGFFSKERPEIKLKDALKDVIPVEWIPKTSTPNDKNKPSKSMNILTNIK